MSMIACLCAVPREDCNCYHCQTVRLRRQLADIVHIIRWYESIIDQMSPPEELDDYHRGYYEALLYMTMDINGILKT